jgi:hypothetical protein
VDGYEEGRKLWYGRWEVEREQRFLSFQRTVRVSVSEQDLSAGKSLIDRPHTISETKDWSIPRGKQHRKLHDPRRARSAFLLSAQ